MIIACTERWTMQKKGFSIVELIVIILVISILASIVLVANRQIRKDAEASAIVAHIKQVEDGFKTYLIRQHISEYPHDGSFGIGNNPTLSAIAAADTVFADYVPVATAEAVLGWEYDNDKDTAAASSCGYNTAWWAVNLRIVNLRPGIAQAIDDAIDDGDLLCGRVRAGAASATYITYKLSFDQKY